MEPAKPSGRDKEIMMVAEGACRQIVENAGAEAVVVIFTTRSKRTTRVWKHSFGNTLLCDAMITKVAEDMEDKDTDEEVEEDEEEEDDD